MDFFFVVIEKIIKSDFTPSSEVFQNGFYRGEHGTEAVFAFLVTSHCPIFTPI